jgi:hypothetical protein
MTVNCEAFGTELELSASLNVSVILLPDTLALLSVGAIWSEPFDTGWLYKPDAVLPLKSCSGLL